MFGLNKQNQLDKINFLFKKVLRTKWTKLATLWQCHSANTILQNVLINFLSYVSEIFP